MSSSLPDVPVSQEPMTILKTRGGKQIAYAQTESNLTTRTVKSLWIGEQRLAWLGHCFIYPLPILELRVLEILSYCEAAEQGEQDITFDYNTDFFLHAALEDTSIVEQTSGMKPLSSSLVGERVKSVDYFEIPFPAGYFVFPDLAVRDEGQYCLKFSLFEELRDNVYGDFLPLDSAFNQMCPLRNGPSALSRDFVSV
ncbi:hypothetical protein N7504_006292 [Penicillium tannophilum]|nr:hypothetical protein N7504_006292 [Penicillium tannophilum]